MKNFILCGKVGNGKSSLLVGLNAKMLEVSNQSYNTYVVESGTAKERVQVIVPKIDYDEYSEIKDGQGKLFLTQALQDHPEAHVLLVSKLSCLATLSTSGLLEFVVSRTDKDNVIYVVETSVDEILQRYLSKHGKVNKPPFETLQVEIQRCQTQFTTGLSQQLLQRLRFIPIVLSTYPLCTSYIRQMFLQDTRLQDFVYTADKLQCMLIVDMTLV